MLNVSDYLAYFSPVYIEPTLCNKMCLGASTYQKALYQLKLSKWRKSCRIYCKAWLFRNFIIMYFMRSN